LGTKVAPTNVCGEKTAGSPPHGERPMAEDIVAPQTEGWTPWPTRLHATDEEKKKKEEEE